MADPTKDPKTGSTRDTETVERLIPAPAAAIFALLADPSRHREIDGSGTVRDAADGAQQLTLGSTFGMSMKAGIPYSMASTVIEFEQDRRIAWQTRAPLRAMRLFIGGRIWRYQLEPTAGGTLVSETWDISQERVPMLIRPLRGSTRKAMTATLQKIEEIVTA